MKLQHIITWPAPWWRKNYTFHGSVRRAKVGTTVSFLGTTLVLIYLVRSTIFFLWAGPSQRFLIDGGRILLVASIVFLIAKGINRITVSGIIYAVATFPGILFSSEFDQSILKWTGWVLLFVVTGPVIQSSHARYLRHAAWNTMRLAFIAVGTASFAWYLLGMPNLGRGAFTGITLHSMVLGPISAMAFLLCMHAAILKRSRLYLALAMLVLIPCMLAGSRTAVLGLAAGIIALMSLYAIRVGFSRIAPVLGLILLFVVMGVSFAEGVKNSNGFYNYTRTLQEKGMQNTRKALWAARLEEFKSNPVFGIGIGMGTGSGVERNSAGKVNVEPGSSYLVLLSMTGLIGTLSFIGVIAQLLASMWRNKSVKMTDPLLSETLVIGSFWAVHMISEGYIYAVGSPFCLFVWLCLGRINDLSYNKAFSNAKGKRSLRRTNSFYHQTSRTL